EREIADGGEIGTSQRLYSLLEPLSQHGLQRNRDDDDQAVDQLRPIAGQIRRYDTGIDRADDEGSNESAEDGPRAPEDRGAAQENGRQGIEQVSPAQRRPEVEHFLADDKT